jgi:hypothetical protein
LIAKPDKGIHDIKQCTTTASLNGEPKVKYQNLVSEKGNE